MLTQRLGDIYTWWQWQGDTVMWWHSDMVTQCYDNTVSYLILSSSMESMMLFLMLTVSSSSCSRTASRFLSVSVFWWSEDRHMPLLAQTELTSDTLWHNKTALLLPHTGECTVIVPTVYIINHIILNIILLTPSTVENSFVSWYASGVYETYFDITQPVDMLIDSNNANYKHRICTVIKTLKYQQ